MSKITKHFLVSADILPERLKNARFLRENDEMFVCLDHVEEDHECLWLSPKDAIEILRGMQTFISAFGKAVEKIKDEDL